MTASKRKVSPNNAKAESREVDFKATFDPDQRGSWCELIKDIVAMANSGGGTILFGVDDDGTVVDDESALKILEVDPATFTDKIARFTGTQFDSFTIALGKRSGQKIAILTIGIADLPMIFEKEGSYSLPSSKPKIAFAVGSLYVRHGAKSEPAKSSDVARMIGRSIGRVRKEWLSRVRKVTSAPSGSQISVLTPKVRQSGDPDATPIRITDNPGAPEYQLIDPNKTHPWRGKELLKKVNQSLPTKITPHDLLAVRRIHDVDRDRNFVYRPRFSSAQYSPAFANWLLGQHRDDPTFFEKCRSDFKKTGFANIQEDERLRWLSKYMSKSNLSGSTMAKRLKVAPATLSRLFAGKYHGDVLGMLERIGDYRHSLESNNETVS